MASVPMREGILSTAVSVPETRPNTQHSSSVSRKATGMDRPIWVISVAERQPAKARMEPTEMSISPTSSTMVIPTPAMP